MNAIPNQRSVSNVPSPPTLTVILPTRNANELLEHSITSVLDSNDQRFELLLVNNNFPLQIILNRNLINDKRVRIINPDRKLSMSENWHLGLSSALGKWITFMGSDDGIVTANISKVIDILENAHEFDEAVLFRSIGFTYPINNRPSWFELPEKPPSQKISKIRNSGVLCALFPTQMVSTLPMPYGGAICRKKLFSLIMSSESRIPGIAPDYFLGFYVGLSAKRMLFADEFFAIRGVSEISNGFQTLNDVKTPNMIDFLSDAEAVNMGSFKKSDIKCRTKISTLDYLKARQYSRPNCLNLSAQLLLKMSQLTCIEEGHHKSFLVTKSLPLRRLLFKNLGYLIRKLWFLGIGVKTKNLRCRKLYLERYENISSIQPRIRSIYRNGG